MRPAGSGLRPFPASTSQLVVPASDRRSARAGMAMYAPCRPRSVAVRDALWWAVRLLGPRVLRTPDAGWPLPLDRDAWAALSGQLRAEAPAWDALAVYRRPAERPGATVALLAGGRQVAIVRLEPEHEPGLSREIAALRLVAGHGPSTFAVPAVGATGRCAGWTWALQAPLPLGRHRMAVGASVERVAEEVGEALAGLPRPAGTPPRWRPSHGDFVPWNLRTVRGGGVALLDWESVGWAPPGADLLLYDVSARAVGRRAGVRPQPSDEVVSYWHDAVTRRLRAAADRGLPPDPLNHRILRLLEAVGGRMRSAVR